MSNYDNNNPPNPYGAPYGQPGYGQPAYSPPPYGQPEYALAPGQYSHWVKRVGASLIDGLIGMVLFIPYYIGILMAVGNATTTYNENTMQYETTTSGGNPFGWVLVVIGLVAAVAFWIWNVCLKQGSTGYTIGKGVLGIKLIKEDTGQPMGAGMSFVRQIAHILDGICYIGYLWPLWDPKRQTFADKIMTTVVIDQPKG